MSNAKTLSVAKSNRKDTARAVVEQARREAYAELSVVREVVLSRRKESKEGSKKK
jgi:hypothetical protein